MNAPLIPSSISIQIDSLSAEMSWFELASRRAWAKPAELLPKVKALKDQLKQLEQDLKEERTRQAIAQREAKRNAV